MICHNTHCVRTENVHGLSNLHCSTCRRELSYMCYRMPGTQGPNSCGGRRPTFRPHQRRLCSQPEKRRTASSPTHSIESPATGHLKAPSRGQTTNTRWRWETVPPLASGTAVATLAAAAAAAAARRLRILEDLPSQ